MAQLYKMSLYVCDLEESLSLDEIKILIAERALDGISVSSICHFADEQIGDQVEWDDDIDLNRCGCPTSTWDKYFTPPKKPQTNADRFRSMTDEDLAKALYYGFDTEYCTNDPACAAMLDEPDGIPEEKCIGCLLNWLRQPAE